MVLIVAAEIVGGWRVIGPNWPGGDLLYHSALANAILHGELPPGGAYAGLPSYYPPGFHAMAAAVMAVLGFAFSRADQLLTLAWLPVLPVGTFLLARWLTGRPWVAVLAATLTVFAGAYDLSAGRLWVNSLFMVGHEAYPLYPRDVVFALLPFAFLAFFKALAADGPRPALTWAAIAGVLFGTCSLVQVQLLLPIPIALVAVVIVAAIRSPERRWQTVGVLLLTGGLAAALFAPWFLGQLEAIRRNGGVALESADTLVAGPLRAVELPARVRTAPSARGDRRGCGPALPAQTRRSPARWPDAGAVASEPRGGAARAGRSGSRSRSRWASCTNPTGRSRTPSGRSGCGCSPANR